MGFDVICKGDWYYRRFETLQKVKKKVYRLKI